MNLKDFIFKKKTVKLVDSVTYNMTIHDNMTIHMAKWQYIWQNDNTYDKMTIHMTIWHCIWQYDIAYDNMIIHITIWWHMTKWHCIWQCDNTYDNMTLHTLVAKADYRGATAPKNCNFEEY